MKEKEKMMKRLLIFMLVLGMASLANATVIDVVIGGVGTGGHAGTAADPLDHNEEILIKLILNDNDSMSPPLVGSSYPAYDGYWLVGMDVSLTTDAIGDLFTVATPPPAQMKHHIGFSPWADSGVVGGDIAYLAAAGGTGDGIAGAGTPDLVWNIWFRADASNGGASLVDIALHGTSKYTNSPVSWGSTYGDISDHIMTNADLSDLTIHVVPEPMTVLLLSLGGLFLRRHRIRRG